ncbi:DDB1- and CUL4-associated factor 17-like isoform X4 [Acanthaster planci]|uniref:DDB1- and CUL4-associated factor 17-like isoform X4 n=1 Tax=Acanthaster planci TaxID=133434 RepID=A0A8B7Z9V3_ACAPL|nr:DDB1- and CUL4-associated factor 17-like isoform X4 [Acanthaster planci]
MSDELIWRCNKPNIVMHLRAREADLGKSPAYRRNCRMWRTLICDKSSVYKKTWSLTSKNKIHYLGDRLYMDDFRTCYSLNGLNAMPTVIYKKPDKSHIYKLEANLHCCAELNTLPVANAGHRPYILGLTKCQHLIRIDLKTGRILQKIFLGQHHLFSKFIYLNWDVFQERAVACSTQSKSSTGPMKSFVLLSVFPLDVIGQLTVTQQVFGADICNANISDGLLIVMHRNNRVRMYNLDQIIKEVESGLLEMDSDSDDVTMAFFHMDDSQRIIQLGDYDLIVNAFHTRDDGKIELQIVYRVSHPVVDKHLEGEEEKQQKDLANWETTLSGRRVSTKWRKQLRVRNQIRDISFDSELDFLLVSFVTTTGFSPVGTKGELGIYCNQTGRLLKMMDLDIAEFDTPSCPTLIEMDMDFMVHIYEGDHRGKMTCSLYRLDRPME